MKDILLNYKILFYGRRIYYFKVKEDRFSSHHKRKEDISESILIDMLKTYTNPKAAALMMQSVPMYFVGSEWAFQNSNNYTFLHPIVKHLVIYFLLI